MLLIYFMMILITMIALLMIFLVNLISKKTFHDREKSSPFECGFDPKSSARLPFSIQFFLITVIFLIFDIEITLILPMIYTIKTSKLMEFIYISIIFMFILLLGIYHEWRQGALNWMY
uniref:NADH-ubiquinone oxidoreductase chain 3 n=1 Tax=Cucujoidea sp. 13 KM-2017 TaxID=2219349 RepID=A0A346RJZ7_9CUCU|nr:NADH dehydrogenase subunit 3 [Cucujoidea sp. 13 KM-2017]